jgi:photosystem II stability/assembly factor-like uncharacterized protein
MMKKIVTAALITLGVWAPAATASGESIGTLSHIHAVRAFGDQIILGTHEGLYQYLTEKSVKRINPEKFDVMGLAVSNKGLFASGHPGPGSKLKEPVGLLFTPKQAGKWQELSLSGVVDFHTLETVGEEVYGADSGSGQLMYSGNGGKSWSKRGVNTFTDIAPNPSKKASVVAVKDGKLFQSTDALKSVKEVKTPFVVESIDWIKGSLIAASGKDLYQSKNAGKSWKKLATLPSIISSVTQSNSLIAFVMGSAIYSSNNGGKSFAKHQSR